MARVSVPRSVRPPRPEARPEGRGAVRRARKCAAKAHTDGRGRARQASENAGKRLCAPGCARWRTAREIFRVPSRCTRGRDDRAQWTRAEPAGSILPLRRQTPTSSSKPYLILCDRAARPVRVRLPALPRHVPYREGKDLFSLSPTGEEVFMQSLGFGDAWFTCAGCRAIWWNPHAAAPRGGATAYGRRVRKTAGISLNSDRPCFRESNLIWSQVLLAQGHDRCTSRGTFRWGSRPAVTLHRNSKAAFACSRWPSPENLCSISLTIGVHLFEIL